MPPSKSVFLVFGATGQTGQHFVSLAVQAGHRVRALVRNPQKLANPGPNVELHTGSIDDFDKLDALVKGVDAVVVMLGDAKRQQTEKINTAFMKKLVPVLRKHGVKRLLYQAGGFTSPYQQSLPLMTRLMKTIFSGLVGLSGQHRDNEAVLAYLVEEAQDIDWMVHRAAIVGNGPSKGTLKRSGTQMGVATFTDAAAYNYQLLMDDSAIHTYDLSYYPKK